MNRQTIGPVRTYPGFKREGQFKDRFLIKEVMRKHNIMHIFTDAGEAFSVLEFVRY